MYSTCAISVYQASMLIFVNLTQSKANGDGHVISFSAIETENKILYILIDDGFERKAGE